MKYNTYINVDIEETINSINPDLFIKTQEELDNAPTVNRYNRVMDQWFHTFVDTNWYGHPDWVTDENGVKGPARRANDLGLWIAHQDPETITNEQIDLLWCNMMLIKD